MELPPPPSPEAAREARERLEPTLREQRERDEARRIDHEETQRKERSGLRQRLRSELNCGTAKSALELSQTLRPVYRFNSRCERVFVSDTDRSEMINVLESFLQRACVDGRDAATDSETADLIEKINAFDERYLHKGGEPIAYPDFSDSDLMRSPDFCRCTPVLLREMAKPEYRTAKSEIDEAQRRVRARCPNLK